MKTYSPEAVAFLAECEFLFQKYSEELRATTQPYYLSKAIKHIPNYEYRPDDPLIRETLMEHVGSLPMLAAAFYPHVNNADVDLGKALTMLAIHDIGELITGDEITFTKKANAKDPERDAALSLLHKIYHATYDDIETQTSPSAKFAKAIDKINPDILDYLTPAHITIERYKHFVGTEPVKIVALIENKKRPYMLWNPFMTEFHILLLDKLAAKLKTAS
jgi:5'-deoxynucleotidase YfbR-like HD superfamily hydrolase